MGTALRIGIITAYPKEDWHSQQLMKAAQAYGEVTVIRPEHIGARVTREGVCLLADGLDIETMDGFVLARGFGDRGNSDFLIPVYRLLERDNKVVVNSISAVLRAIDKFETSCLLQQAGIPTPAVVVVQDPAMGRLVLKEWGRLVAKPLFGSLGLGITLLEDTPQGHALIPVMLERYGAIYLQEYVPSSGGDIRAFVVGPRVAASIYRKVAPGEWVSNVHRGAQPESVPLDCRTREIAVHAARAVGLDYTGVDLMEGPAGPVVIEVNGNPQWQGVLAATGRNMAEDILAWVVERITLTGVKGGESVARETKR
ncbi:MAG: RimK family alpha-L-glutamate ligase [Armatimonadota bacterium]